MRRSFSFSIVSSGLLLTAGLASGQEMSTIRQQRFTERDANRNGYLSLEEYGGHPGNFHALDRDRDGRLSRSEFVTRGAGAPSDDGNVNTVVPEPIRLESFESMDRNRDGIVSRGEWVGDTFTFNRLDRTDDGRITRDEFLSPLSPDSPEGRLQGKDRNNDGVLTLSEWQDEPTPFERADRNRDGRVTLDEYRYLATDNEIDPRRFADLDLDQDGVLVRREWPRDERRTFDDMDRDADGAVTRREFGDNTYGNTRDSEFDDLDDDRDGRLSAREWPVDNQTFALLDGNRDGRLTRAEFGNRERLSERFRSLDRNRDGSLSRREWRGSTQSFRLLDRDRDGAISRDELAGATGVGRVGVND